jgi:hypothetical protein
MKRLLLVALAACSSAARAPAPIANTPSTPPEPPAPAATKLVDGALWTCQIGDYDPQPCRLKAIGDIWVITKLLGSQRFKGRFRIVDAHTARFIGNYFCPWGDCDAPMDVELQGSASSYTGRFADDSLSIRYDPALASEWGGAGYGRLTGDER